MLKYVVAVFDSALQAYAPPVVVPSKGVAVRSFSDEVNRVAEGNALNGHASDFELRCLGTWNEETGLFSQPGIEVLIRGKDVRTKE